MIPPKVQAARAAYRATLDPTGHGSEDAWAAMQAAEEEWQAEWDAAHPEEAAR